VAVFALSLALHGLVWLQYRADPFSTSYVSDALSYHQWALRISEKGLGAEPVFHQSPLFPLALAWLYGSVAAASRAGAAIFMQAFLNSAAFAMLVPLGRVWFRSYAAGIAAAATALLYSPFVFYGMKLLPVPLALLTQVGALLLLGIARESRKPGPAAACGLAWGLAFLARSETLLFLPVVLLGLWLGVRGTRSGASRSAWLPVAACLAGMAVAVAPITLHNVHQGDLVLVASAGGENLFIGNQRGGDGGHNPLHPQAGDLFSQRALASLVAEQEAGRDLRPSEVSAFWRGRAFREILDGPGDWLGLEVRKLGRILDPGDPSDLYSLPLERRRYLWILYGLPLPTLGLWFLAALGAWLWWRGQDRQAWPLLAFVFLGLAVLMAFFVSTRLRLPLLFSLTPFAGLAIAEGIRNWRAGQRRQRLVAVAALILLATGHWLFLTKPRPREVVRLAAVLSTQDRVEEALTVVDGLLQEPEPDPLALDQAGWLHYKKGDREAARRYYLRALERGLLPGHAAQTRARLAGVHEELGEMDLAAATYDEAVATAPESAGAWFERGRFHLRTGDRESAVRDLRRAAELAPGWQAPRELLRSLSPDPG
jgi:tetratricopeptide (TPR) repeat protein